MNSQSGSSNNDSLDIARQIDALCDDFESRCLTDEQPQIEAFLDRVSAKQELALELIAIEVHYRHCRGESPKPADYQARFPALPLADLESCFEPRLDNIRAPGLTRTLADRPATLNIKGHPQATEGTMVHYFGDYELLDMIARGGMGVVYKARQISLNRIVALKMILSGELASQREIDRFNSEAKAAAVLDHPGIVAIYEVGEHEDKHFFSMTYVEGKSLADHLNENPLDPRSAAQLMAAVCQAVQYAHDRGVIHRDLKPSNILLDSSGRPRVTDFGLAKRLADTSGLTVSGEVLGTPSYMPPEQASGQIDATGPASDVYSLGAILYCMITGRPPFQAASSIETMRQVVEREPVPPRQLNPSIPRDLDTIVSRCLEKSPARRYESAHQLAAELQRFVEGRPIVARPIGKLAKTWRWCRRNPMPASMFTAVGLTMLVATIVSGSFARKESLANKALDREHKEGLRQIAKSFASEANALRMSGRPGQRFGALRAVTESMKITGPTRELADIATGALCLPDCEVDFEWEGFPDGTLRVALSPTFDRYAQVNQAGTISIRSLPEDQEVCSIKVDGVFRDYAALRFSQDGRFLFAVYSAPRQTQVWLIAEKESKLIATENSSWAETLDGRHILIAQGSQLLIVDSTGENPDRTIPVGQDISGYFFGGLFGQSKILLSLGYSWRTIDTQTGEISQAFSQPRILACWPAPHANGQWAVWSTTNPPVGTLVDMQTGSQLAPPFVGHKTQGVTPLISRNGEVAFSNDWHGILRMWDPRSGRSLLNRPSADLNNWQVVSSDNRCIGPETDGNKVRWLRFASGNEFSHVAASIQPDDLVVYSEACAISPDGRLLAFGAQSGLVLCDTLSGLPLVRIAKRGHEEDHVVGFLDDGSLLTVEDFRIVRRKLMRGSDDTLHVGKPSPQAMEITPKGIMVHSAASRDGSVVAIPRGTSGAICIHARNTELKLAAMSDIRCVSVSPDGKYVAAGLHSPNPDNASQSAYVWETATGKIVQQLETRSLCSVAFSPGGRYLTVHSGEVSECRVFEVATWRMINRYPSKYAGIFSPDESLFAIATNSGEVSLLRAPEMIEFAKLASPDEHNYRPLIFTPDNSRLYACNMENEQMCAWNLALIRRGLDELGLAATWPEISLESTPDIAPASLKVIVDTPQPTQDKPLSPNTPTGIELVDLVRRAGWAIVLEMLPRLEAAEQQRFPGIRQFADDVRRLEASLDATTPPRKWSPIDVEALIHRNPHFWRALYEIAPGDTSHTVIHIGLLSACGELEQAHNLLHLLLLSDQTAQQNANRLKPLDQLLHLWLSESGSMVKAGMKYHDSSEYDKAKATFTAALEIWPQNAEAHYELGFTQSALGDKAAQQHFASSRYYDPLRRELVPVSLLPMMIPECQHAAQAKSLFKVFLTTKDDVDDSRLLKFAELCQLAAPFESRFHELALVVRQLVIARKGSYDDQDRTFITNSLKQLVPTMSIDPMLQRITGDKSGLFRGD